MAATLEDALSLIASLILDDGRRWGDAAMPWQWDAAKAILDPKSRPYRWESRPRGGSKTTDAAAWIIVMLVLVLPAGSECYAFAADLDQARRVRDFINGFVARTPGLASLITVDRYRITSSTGSTLEIMSADGASAFSLLGSFFLVDELCQWNATENARTLWTAIMSGLGKVPGAKLCVITTSGDPGSWSHGIYKHAVRSPLWSVAELKGPLPWTDPEYLEDQKESLLPAEYSRYHLNEWATGSDRLTNEADLEKCVSLAGPMSPEPGRLYVVSADLGWKHDSSVVAVMHAEPQFNDAGEVRGRLLVLDDLRVWEPKPGQEVTLADVKAQIIEFSRQYNHAAAIIDPREAVGSLQEFRAMGMDAEQYNYTEKSVGTLGLVLFRAIRSHNLAIWRHQALIDQLLSVKLVEKTPGNFKLDHSHSGHDDMATTLAMGIFKLLERSVGHAEILFDESPSTTALDGQPIQVLNGAYAMNPADLLSNHLDITGGW